MPKRSALALAIGFAVAVGIDQGTKAWATTALAHVASVRVADSIYLTLALHRGATWSGVPAWIAAATLGAALLAFAAVVLLKWPRAGAPFAAGIGVAAGAKASAAISWVAQGWETKFLVVGDAAMNASHVLFWLGLAVAALSVAFALRGPSRR